MKSPGIILMLLAACLSSCHMFTEERNKEVVAGDSNQLVRPNAKINQDEPAPTVVHEYKTRTGELIKIEEFHPRGEKRSDLKLSIRNEMSGLNIISDVDPVSQVLLADLNQNGFEEVYIITASFDNSNMGAVYGYECVENKYLSRIGTPTLTNKDLQKGGLFEGYYGDDQFRIESNQLVRSYPLRENQNSRVYLVYGLDKNNTGDTLVLRQRKKNY